MALTLSDSAHSLREFGLRTALTLASAAKEAPPQNYKEIKALSERLIFCNEIQNSWIGNNLHSGETGELFSGFGRFWHCYSKLCAYCQRLQAKRNRKKLRVIISQQKLLVGQHFRFITLTIPNLGLNLITTRRLINRAWCLFRKRESVFGCIVGGVKAEEFTVSAKGIHYHLHLLAVSRFIHKDDLRWVWTQCVRTAFEEENIEFIVPTIDNLLITNIKIVHDLKQVVNEVCKYITKSNSWDKIPVEALCEIALLPRWSRMFECFGSFRCNIGNETENRNSDLSDGTQIAVWSFPSPVLKIARNYWRTLLNKLTLTSYLKRLEAEVRDTQRRRLDILRQKFPFAVIIPLDSS